ncbi:MAG: T9SS type A sorting domain-containing protein, partial [Ignavibacteria bacterium]
GNAVNRNGGDSGDEWNFMAPIQITVAASTNIDDIQELRALQVFPNPIQEYSMFQFSLQTSSEVTYEIIDMMGRTLFTQPLGVLNEGIHSVNFLGLYSMLNSGHYMISVQTTSGRQTIPFLKQ